MLPNRRHLLLIGCMRQLAVRREEHLFSPEQRHPSMGKMPCPSWQAPRLPGRGLCPPGRLERRQLPIRDSMKEGFEQHCRFTQAGVEVVVHRVQRLPIAFRPDGLVFTQSVGSGLEAEAQLFHQIRHRADFVNKLRLACEQDAAEQVIETRCPLASGTLEVFWVQWS